MDRSTSVCIIPARGGSKRIPRKNIKEFCGKPIIAYSIEIALKSGLFERVVVSTDDNEIAEVAKQYGAEVPFMRPATLSDDFAGTSAVFLHALEWLKDQGKDYEYACCIYATAPFIQEQYLKDGLGIVRSGEADSAFSVTSYPYPIYRSLQQTDAGFVEMIWPEYKMTRSQDLPEAYHDAGQFYWVRCESFFEQKTIMGNQTKSIILPQYLVQDIDTEEDWLRAELMFRALNRGNH